MSNIVIYEGDESRPRISTYINRESFFCESYNKALKQISQLVEEADEYKNDESKTDRLPYHIGNNIIAFSGQRGQGKTSALRTFSRLLDIKKCDNDKREDVIFEFPKVDFYVLDPIEPNLLHNDVSIVRILLSIMFNSLQDKMKGIQSNAGCDNDLQYECQKLMELFKKAFRNIDYNIKDYEYDYGMDDLEMLSQLGNSGMLKENLQTLISEFLAFCSKYTYGKKYQYLVIQIDDADMASGNIFKICEDIYNYFSVNNAIVLMAADMEQLEYAIEKKYLEMDYDLISVRQGDEKTRYIENCTKLANRYMEKMFPTGRRINLPDIQNYFQKQFDMIKLEYYVDKKDLFSDFSRCKDIQSQLLKLLYVRTGLIFKNENVSMHPLLPTTMRGLTHFLRLLNHMSEVDFAKVYNEVPNEQDSDSDKRDTMRETWLLDRNLKLLEEYFYDEWCGYKLSDIEKQKFSSHRHDPLYIIERNLNEILILSMENENAPKEYRNYSEEGAYILRTIMLNQRFWDALTDVDTNRQLKRYCQRNHLRQWEKIFISEESSDKLGEEVTDIHQPLLIRYPINTDNITRFLDSQDDNNLEIIKREFINGNPFIINEDSDYYFYLFQPILTMLDIRDDKENPINSTDNDASTNDVGSGEKRVLMIGSNNASKDYIKTIFANSEVYYWITMQLEIWAQKFNSQPDSINARLNRIYSEIFCILGEWSRDSEFSYLALSDASETFTSKLVELINNLEEQNLVLFLSNERNLIFYDDQLGISIEQYANYLIESTDSLKDQLKEKKAVLEYDRTKEIIIRLTTITDMSRIKTFIKKKSDQVNRKGSDADNLEYARLYRLLEYANKIRGYEVSVQNTKDEYNAFLQEIVTTKENTTDIARNQVPSKDANDHTIIDRIEKLDSRSEEALEQKMKAVTYDIVKIDHAEDEKKSQDQETDIQNIIDLKKNEMYEKLSEIRNSIEDVIQQLKIWMDEISKK